MNTLVYTSIINGIIVAGMIIYMVWFDMSEVAGKVFVTLLIILIMQIISYLVMRDINEERSGKDDGTIAK